MPYLPHTLVIPNSFVNIITLSTSNAAQQISPRISQSLNPSIPQASPVRPSLSAIHLSTAPRSLTLSPTLKGLQSIVRPFGIWLQPKQSRMGWSLAFWGGRISKEMIRRRKAVYSSRLARWVPTHLENRTRLDGNALGVCMMGRTGGRGAYIRLPAPRA